MIWKYGNEFISEDIVSVTAEDVLSALRFARESGHGAIDEESIAYNKATAACGGISPTWIHRADYVPDEVAA